MSAAIHVFWLAGKQVGLLVPKFMSVRTLRKRTFLLLGQFESAWPGINSRKLHSAFGSMNRNRTAAQSRHHLPPQSAVKSNMFL